MRALGKAGLPDALDIAGRRYRLARSVKHDFFAATAFYADDQGQDHLRLSYCYPTPERIREGVRRLAAVVESELEVQQTFGGSQGWAAAPANPHRRVQSPGPDLTRSFAHYVTSIDGIFFWQRVLFGLAGPALLSYLTWEMAKIRSTQSATGILYVDFFTVVVGEVLAKYILLATRVPV